MPPATNARIWSKLRWLLLLPLPVLWCVLDHYGALTFLENKLVDLRFRYRGERKAPVKLVYVDVGTLSLSEIGGWPWSRGYFARISSALINEGHAKAVAFDFVFSDLGVPESVDLARLVQGNAEFGRFLFRQPPVALAASYAGHTYIDFNGVERQRELSLVSVDRRAPDKIEPPEIPAFRRSINQTVFYNPPVVGLIDTIANGTRTVPAWAPNNTGRVYFHMALELARLYWGLPQGALQVKTDRIDFVRPDGSIQASVPLRDRQLLDINWFTRWTSPQFAHLEFSRLYAVANDLGNGTEEEKKAARDYFAQGVFKDAVVLIGPVDPLFQDLAPTSLDPDYVPKVGIHGNLLQTIVSGEYIRRAPTWRGIAWLDHATAFGLAVLVTALAIASGRKPWHGLAAKLGAAVVLAGYAVVAFEVFRASPLLLPMAAPLGAAFTTSFAGLVWRVIDEQKAKSRIKGMFGTYLAPTVVNQMIESGRDPELGGHDAEITAYFSDIQSFSSFSEVLPSSKLAELLNEYLTACTDIVQGETGTLDKYIGDAVVAIFGAPVDAPDHAYRACLASLLVQRRIGGLREKWRGEGDRWPTPVHNLRTRIGLNTGVCMIGNMGSRSRFNYTMMGDNVNLAARMESGAKSWGAYTMCTEATKIGCEQHQSGAVVFRPLGRVVVKGRTQPVPFFEILGLRKEAPDRALECVALFEQGLVRYYARDWDGAEGLFRRSAMLEPNQPDKVAGIATNPSLVYLDIVDHCRIQPPPADWDGRYVMKEK